MEDKGTLVKIDLTRELCIADEVELVLGDYEFVFKAGKPSFVKKKPEYPRNYDECCEVLDYNKNLVIGTMPRKYENLIKLQKLLICRDAYWKIAGDWKPDWTNVIEIKYCIINDEDKIKKSIHGSKNKILAFPTAEMRDSFLENFKTDIENCKEFL